MDQLERMKLIKGHNLIMIDLDMNMINILRDLLLMMIEAKKGEFTMMRLKRMK